MYIKKNDGSESIVEVGAADNTKLPLTGGTITGTVVFNSAPTFNTAIAMGSTLNVASSIGIAGTTVIDASRNLTNIGTATFSGGTTNKTDAANILTLNASEHARLLVDTSSTGGHRASLVLESNSQETVLSTTGSVSELTVPVGDFILDVAEGIVLDIPAVSSGGIVSEGEPIVTLVQSNQPLFLEIEIDPKQISDIKLGMKVSIKLDSMPFQEFGGLDGELIYFSNDTFNESLSGDKGVFYRKEDGSVWIELSSD